MGGDCRRFEEASDHDAELNERQREVLDLIVAGKTNAEIGEALGITLDGAKWNVSEILTKLGVESREEAAEYWRWRNRGSRRLVRALRGIFAASTIKVAAGVGGLAVAGVAGVAVWLGFFHDATPEVASAESFYLEASIAVRSDPSPQDIGSTIAGQATPTGSPVENRFTLRWWNQDRDHGRWELDGLTPSLDQRDFVVVYDGADEWSYDSSRNSYTRKPLTPLPPQLKARPIAMAAWVGPYPASTVRAMVDMLVAGRTDTRVTIAGEGQVVGRRAQIVELSPASRSSGVDTNRTPTAEIASGILRFWVDPLTMFVLKSELVDDTGRGQTFVAEVTKLEMPASIPADKLRFVPPKGATLSTGDPQVYGGGMSVPAVSPVAGSAATPIAGWAQLNPGGLHPPVGFLDIARLPDGYRSTGEQQSSDSQGIYEWTVTLDDGSGRRATIEQRKRADGLPDLLKAGRVVGLPQGLQGYESIDGTQRTLAFEKGAISVAISSAALGSNDLLLIAAGMLAP